MESLNNKEIIRGLKKINEEDNWYQKAKERCEALKDEYANIQTIQIGSEIFTHTYGYYPNESYFTSNLSDPLTHSSKWIPHDKMESILKKAEVDGAEVQITKGEIQPPGTGSYKPGYSGYMGRP